MDGGCPPLAFLAVAGFPGLWAGREQQARPAQAKPPENSGWGGARAIASPPQHALQLQEAGHPISETTGSCGRRDPLFSVLCETRTPSARFSHFGAGTEEDSRLWAPAFGTPASPLPVALGQNAVSWTAAGGPCFLRWGCSPTPQQEC